MPRLLPNEIEPSTSPPPIAEENVARRAAPGPPSQFAQLWRLTRIHDQITGHRNVSYYTTPHGFVVIDGDIIYGSVDDFTEHGLPDGHPPSDSPPISSRALTIDAQATWPNATIRFKFDSNETESALSNLMMTATSRWLKGAPYLKFHQEINSPYGIDGVLTVTAKPCGGCNAVVGYSATPRWMNLEQSCEGGKVTCGADEATHELGHVLGFYHEHQRPDREQFVRFDCSSLAPGCPDMPTGKTCCDKDSSNSSVPSGCCGALRNFDTVESNRSTIDMSGPYDLQSVMQYRSDAFASPGKHTLVAAKKGVVVPSKTNGFPSLIDFHRVCQLYQKDCPFTADEPFFWWGMQSRRRGIPRRYWVIPG